ncbi:beta-galactosidase [Pedobacter sp. AW31-3R]|uniref:beta-galactosidase n=1 Tax=Pedobacter sp. AW31-3R TaxID=3445781 RepID=UPI003F9F5EDC
MKRIFYLLFFLHLFCPESLLAQTPIVSWSGGGESPPGDKGLHAASADGILHLSAAKGGIYQYTIPVPVANKDVRPFRAIQFAVSNSGTSASRISAKLNDKSWFGGSTLVLPGEADTLEIWFLHPSDHQQKSFLGMDGLPGGNASIWDPVDPAGLTSITLELKSDAPLGLNLGTISGAGLYQDVSTLAKDSFFPFIDGYGQFIHSEWPDKVHSAAAFAKSAEKERAELALFQGPLNFDTYGGWLDGPQLQATGSFRTEKIEGKWWLVDPEGHLFWSHGVNCVGFDSGVTEIDGREKYFRDLPANSGVSQAFYKVRDGKAQFNYYSQNLFRKYGSDWRSRATDGVFKRMRSWGLNTIGNWSDPEIYLSHTGKKLPYTVNVDYPFVAVDGKSFKFPDVFDKGFKPAVTAAAKRAALKTAQDPFCMGYFVDNELKLLQLTAACMKQSPAGAAKNAFIHYLKARFGTISKLNASWGTPYKNWNTLLRDTLLPAKAAVEMADFDQLMIDRYYAVCRATIKEAAPEKLYLGSRFNLYRIYYPQDTSLNMAMRIAAKYCDVVSINYYRYGSEDLVLPADVDKPIIIGEFHFGAPDRGLPHSGLRNAFSQSQRAKLYEGYVKESLHNPQIVGTHWFQYGDQPYTGRFDGENYQIGFVDICDQPYAETVQALRQIGYHMYQIRFSGLWNEGMAK